MSINLKKPYFVILVTFILHILAINFYPINFEYTFIEGMNYAVQNFDKKIITVYFQNQANTFFFPFVGSIIKYIFPYIDPQYIAKFLSASGYFFLGFGIVNLHRILKTKYPLSILLIIIFLNPLIWTFGYRGTPDFLAASIAIYSVSLILDKSISIFKNYIGFFLLGVAIALKPITGIFYITFLIFLLKRKISINEKLKELFLSGLITFIIPIIYFLLIYINFKFFLLPKNFVNVHKIAIYASNSDGDNFFFLNNFFVYIAFLFIFLTPINFVLIFDNLKNFKKYFYILLTLFFFMGLFLQPSGEMSFGPLSEYFNRFMFNGIYGIFIFLFLFICKMRFKNFYDLDLSKIFILSLLFLYFSLSFTATSQRYLILSIPILIICFIRSKDKKDKITFFLTVILFLPVNFFLILNQYATGNASTKMVKYIINSNIINITCAGAIGPHVNNFFDYKNRKYNDCIRISKYVVVEGNNSGAIYQTKSVFKKFSLIKVSDL